MHDWGQRDSRMYATVTVTNHDIRAVLLGGQIGKLTLMLAQLLWA